MRSVSNRFVHVVLVSASAVLAIGSLSAAADPLETPPASECSVSIADTVAGSPAPACVQPSLEPQAANVVTVVARDLYFDPKELVIPSEGTTIVRLEDDGVVVHNFTIDDLDVTTVAQPGGVSETTIVDPPPGTYQFYCSVSGHRQAGMVGTLTVLAPDAWPPSTAEPTFAEPASPEPSPGPSTSPRA